MDGEYIGELDVECWLCSGKEVVELVNLELGLSSAHIDHVRPDVLQTIDGLSDVAVERL
jgi:hypothetical protein